MPDHMPDVVKQSCNDKRVMASIGERARLQLVLDHRDVFAEVRHSACRIEGSLDLSHTSSVWSDSFIDPPFEHRNRRGQPVEICVAALQVACSAAAFERRASVEDAGVVETMQSPGSSVTWRCNSGRSRVAANTRSAR